MTADLIHPAVQALAKIRPQFAAPISVMPIWNEPRAQVFRLLSGADSLAAKRCEPPIAELERHVYAEILPALKLDSLRCYGVVADGEPGSAWILLEHSGGQMYCPQIDEQRIATAAWFAAMHIAGVELGSDHQFADRTPAGYLQQLRSARATLLAHRNHPLLSAGDQTIIASMTRRFDAIESRWRALADACAVLPFTFVHGDLQPKNLHIAEGDSGIRVLAIDWEHSGWGSPAVDIAYLDLPSYFAVVSRRFPALDWKAFVRLARIGQLFQSIAAVHWATLSLPHDDALIDIRWYDSLIPGDLDEILDCECG